MQTAPAAMLALLLLLGCLASNCARAGRLQGSYFSGEGDAQFLQLLDTARLQWSSTGVEYQSVNQLYRGDWDGLMEGPTWGAWWTQNTYGPTMTALPFMEDATWAALSHSMAWWFNSIGNGTSLGKGASHDGGIGAPDGCLCDAAVPVPPGNGQGCWYKQGDGDVPLHDWTMEESLSAVVMQAEMLLISRNRTGIAHFLPLFLRTCSMLEGRRHAATGYTTFLTGPGSNLLAPSFGGGPNGSWSYLSGVSVTYTAALNRLIELARLVSHPMLPTLIHRRDLNLAGIKRYLLTSGPESEVAGRDRSYLVMSREPATGVLHGKIDASRHGYFEASPNHDAVFLRVVDDATAEGIMALTDKLSARIRPHTFMIPNTDAGGGVGYDDMLPNHYDNNSRPTGMYTYGQWVNGGVWSTQDSRAMMAYFRTDRQQLAKASMQRMLEGFSSDWKMDAPLTQFGSDTWGHDPEGTMCTYDAFGHASAMVRGMFEYLYSATSLELVPHHPDNITQITQSFGIRWGPHRIFISASGVRSSGIASAELNGQAIHTFNATSLTLDFAALPVASAAATAATESDVSTAADDLHLVMTYKSKALPPSPPSPPLPPPPPTPTGVPAGFAMRLSAADLVAQGFMDGHNVTTWHTSADSVVPDTVATAQPGPGGAPTLKVRVGVPGVEFDGKLTMLNGKLKLNATMTILAVIHDTGSPSIFSSVFVTETDRGLAITPEGCATGDPIAPGPCNASAARVVSIDWVGSGNLGAHNVSHRLAVAAVTYSASNLAASSVDGCAEQQKGGGDQLLSQVPVPGAPSTHEFHVGSRNNPGYGRYFKGTLHELIVYGRELTADELAAATTTLRQRYDIPPLDCALPRPVPTLDCTALRSSCVKGTWPRGCGLNATEEARLKSFLQAAAAQPETKASVPYAMALTASDFMSGFEERCVGKAQPNSPTLTDSAITAIMHFLLLLFELNDLAIESPRQNSSDYSTT
jgi:hypothetical protein